ncbi:MAG: helix-turn-helix transcriptional regulator [Desulfobacteraceae bacterium]|nr:helix-turn-helix transcriptional regulator [Desulfobacteraceae bacterium]
MTKTKIDIKQARQTLGLNQTQMAKAMGVSRGLWIKWEKGDEQGITAAPTRLLETLMWLHSKDLFSEYQEKFS